MTRADGDGERVELLDGCDSTQDEVRARLARAAPHELVAVAARTQRAGRGRAGRRWEDPPGAAVLLSVGVRGPLSTRVLEDLPLDVAAIVVEVLGTSGVVRRAPNDLVDSAGRKVGGVLVDARTSADVVEEVVVGVGVNLSGNPFVTADGRAASSLAHAGWRGDPSRLLDALADALLVRISAPR